MFHTDTVPLTRFQINLNPISFSSSRTLHRVHHEIDKSFSACSLFVDCSRVENTSALNDISQTLT